jgi:hypothetical protein
MTALTGRLASLGRFLLYGTMGVCAGAAVWLASYVPAADWHMYYGVARGVFDGRSPYVQPIFVNPPWAVVLLAPFAVFPPNLGRGLLLVCSVVIWLYAAWRMRAPRLAVIAMLLSPTAIGSLLAANIDALVILGVFLPATSGLLLLMIKPQIGLGPAFYDLIETWRTRGITGVLLTFAPVVVAYAVSAVVFPVWLDRFVHAPDIVWNRSLFPYGIPVGIFLLWLSLRRRNVMFALASTPFLTPYLTFYTYLIVQIGLLHEDVERFIPRVWLQIMLCILLWTIMLIFKL